MSFWNPNYSNFSLTESHSSNVAFTISSHFFIHFSLFCSVLFSFCLVGHSFRVPVASPWCSTLYCIFFNFTHWIFSSRICFLFFFLISTLFCSYIIFLISLHHLSEFSFWSLSFSKTAILNFYQLDHKISYFELSSWEIVIFWGWHICMIFHIPCNFALLCLYLK